MPSELLPCPFCGGEAALMEFQVIPDPHIRCQECGAQTEDQHERGDAIAAWNRRALAAVPNAQPQPSTPEDAARRAAESIAPNANVLRYVRNYQTADDPKKVRKWFKEWLAAEVQQAIEESRPRTEGWVSVEDRLPEDPSWVPVFCDGAYDFAYFTDGAFEEREVSGIAASQITHWRPLPAPPKHSPQKGPG